MGYGNATVTTGRRAVAFSSPQAVTGPFFDTQAGSCWQSYGALGMKVPARTSCTVQIGFVHSTPDTYGGSLTVQECARSRLNAAGGIECVRFGDSATIALSGTATPLPDIVPVSVAFETASSYTVTVSNIGAGTAGTFVVQGCWSVDTVLDQADSPACGASTSALLAPGASTDVAIGCGFTPAATDVYLIVVADSGDQVEESDETNNELVEALPSAPGPDLVVTAIQVHGATTGSRFNYTATVENVGNANVDVENAIRVQLWYSVGPTFEPASDIAACGAYFGITPDFILAPGQSVDVPMSSCGNWRAGDNYVLAEVDAQGAVAETNEANNVGRQVLQEMDLTIDSVVVNSVSGTTIDWTVTMRLTELAPSPIVPVEMQGAGVIGNFEPSDNPACGAFQNSSLIITSGQTFAINVVCDSGRSLGDDSITVRIDTQNQLIEFDELNNVGPFPLP